MSKFLKILYVLTLFSFFLLSCGKEASTVDPNATTSTYTDTSPGTTDLQIQNIYPSNGATAVSTSSKVYVIFTKAVNTSTVASRVSISGTGSPSLSYDGLNTSGTIAIFTMSGVQNSTAYTVTVASGIQSDSDGTSLTTGGSATFTTAADSSAGAPVVLAATRLPSGTGVSKSTSYIEVTFSDEMNPATVDAAAFTVTGGLTKGTVSTDDNRTFKLGIFGLSYATAYGVTLAGTIQNSSGTGLSLDGNHTWSFTTETDPDAIANAQIVSVWLTDITTTSATINWTTDEPTASATINYGTDSSYGSPLPEGALLVTSHSLVVTPLTTATRYYFNIDIGTDTHTGYFTTAEDGTSDIVFSTEGGSKTDLNSVQNVDTSGSVDGSSFILWNNGTTGVKAVYINSTGTLQWGGVNGTAIDDINGRTAPRGHSDGIGGLIVTMEDGTNTYAKHIYDNGSGTMLFSWGLDETSAGVQVSNSAGTDAVASLVYGGQGDTNVYYGNVSVQGTGTAVVLSGNWVYDFNTDFTSTAAAVNDVILNTSTNTMTTVTDAGTTYNYALGLTASIFSGGNTYSIGDGTTNTDTFTATNHTMHSATNYNNGTTLIYTDHGYSLPVWLTANDIVYNGTFGALYVSSTNLTFTEIDSGTANANRPNHLIDGSADFVTITPVTIGDYARNTTDNKCAQVTAVTTTDLELASDIFPNGNETYEVFQTISLLTYGTASTTSANELVDSTNLFSSVTANSDYVLNTTDGTVALITAVSGNTLTLDADIMASGESYEIWTGTGSVITSGTANSYWASHLIDGSTDFAAIGSLGTTISYALNTSTSEYGKVSAISTVYLTLDADVFTTGTENYELYNLNTGAPLKSGTTDASVSAGYLLDSDVDFFGVAAGSYVMNTSDTTLTTITSVVANNLSLTDDIFVSGEGYSISTGTTLSTGTNTSVAAGQLVDSGADFVTDGVAVGSYVINTSVSPNLIAQVTTPVTATTLNLDTDIFSGTPQNYTVLNLGIATTGNADSTLASELVDSTTDFSSITVGSYATNTTDGTVTTVTAVISHKAALTHNIFTVATKNYSIVTGTGSLSSGSGSSDRTDHLIDGGTDFTSFGSLDASGDYARNTATNLYAQVTAVTQTDLTLSSDVFPGGNEAYEIFELGTKLLSGSATSTSAGELVDSAHYFSGIPGNSYVLNTTTGEAARVSSVTDSVTIVLDADIMASGNSYEIYSGTQITTGTAKADKTDHLIDGTKTWTSTVNIGDLVQNTSTTFYDTVTAVTDTDLTFASDVFPNGNEGYKIYDDYCVTHMGSGSPYDTNAYAVSPFYGFTVSASIGTSGGNTVDVYDARGITGTAVALSSITNPLLANVDFTSFAAANDFAFNSTNGSWTRVSSVPYAGALSLGSYIFTVNGHGYSILRFNPAVPDGAGGILAAGRDTAGTANELNDTGVGSSAEKGDLVYNITDNTYAVVTSVAANTLTLNKDIFDINEGYIVFDSSDRITETGINTGTGTTLTDASALFQTSGVQEGDIVRNITTDAEAVVTTVTDENNIVLSSAIMNNTDVYVILQPRILFSYLNGGGLYSQLVRLRDGSKYGSEIDIYTGGTATNLWSVSNDSGNAFLVFQVGTTIYAKQINGIGSIVAGGAAAMATTSIGTGSIMKVLKDGAGGFYVLYENGGNVYLARWDSGLSANTNWATARTVGAGVDADLVLDSGGDPMVAFANSGNVYVSKYTAANGVTYTGQVLNSQASFVENTDANKGNIRIVNDGSIGAVITWADYRGYAGFGYSIYALAVDGSGAPSTAWDSDLGAATDYDGILIGIPNIYDKDELSFVTVNTDDGSYWDPIFIWADYRNSTTEADFYYDTVSYD